MSLVLQVGVQGQCNSAHEGASTVLLRSDSLSPIGARVDPSTWREAARTPNHNLGRVSA
jgi:hypothetical protein